MPKTEVIHTINRYVLILVALTSLAAVPTARAQDALAKTGPGDPLGTLLPMPRRGWRGRGWPELHPRRPPPGVPPDRCPERPSQVEAVPAGQERQQAKGPRSALALQDRDAAEVDRGWCHELQPAGSQTQLHLIDTLLEAKMLIERWGVEYNTLRPHSAFGVSASGPGSVAAVGSRFCYAAAASNGPGSHHGNPNSNNWYHPWGQVRKRVRLIKNASWPRL